MKNLYVLFASSLILIFFNACQQDCASSEKCKLKPESGPCKAAIPRYYYDQKDKKCKQFTWGGCGKEYFKTKEECEKDCGCK